MSSKVRAAAKKWRNFNHEHPILEGEENRGIRLSSIYQNGNEDATIPKKQCIPSRVSEKFSKKTCSKFASKVEGGSICKCGRLKQEHRLQKEEDNVDGKAEEKWDPKKHLIKCPTNACGTIEFSGQNRKSQGKFIRLADDTDGATAFSFLLHEWDLKPPKLLISVTGGAKNFRLEQKLKSLFNNGLLKVAQTSGAWVITGGTNTGVMKHVGKALQGASQYDAGRFRFGRGRNRVHCIGIATWGIVDHRKSLVNSEDVCRYQMTSSMDSKGACLDNNHTHFLLVDDGTVNAYGKEITFRSKLEKEIMLSNNGVPAVLLVLEGGPNTVLTVHEAITNEPPMPVVIIKDSGRAADLIAFAYDLLHGEGLLLDFGDAVEHTQLMMKIKQVNPELSQERCREMYENIVSVVKNRDFVTIFRMEEGSADLDHAILNALLKSQSTSKVEQLKLAMTWNRVDIARTQIFTDEAMWNTNDLDEAMMTALSTNRIDFIDLLIESGADLHNVVTPNRLEVLYNARKNTGFSMMKHLFDVKREITLDHVDKVLVRLLGDSMENRYRDMEKTHREWRGYRKNWCMTPSHELFIWSVICNMSGMALCFWRTGDEALAKALVGCKMYQSMVDLGDWKNVQEDLILSIEKNMRELQSLAIQLLDECCRCDEPMAAKLLTYRLTSWGNNTCLSWAVAAGFEEFVAHGSCQALLTDMWDGAMSIKTHQSIKTFLGILCPPLIFTFHFASKRERDNMPTTDDPHQETVKETGEKEQPEEQPEGKDNCSMPRNESTDMVAKVAIEEDEALKYHKRGRRAFLTRDASGRRSTSLDLSPQLPWYEKIQEFYKAPITKFWSNVLAYLAFLLLFAYVVLVKLPPRPSVPEWVLIVFVISLTTEELRQLLESEADDLSKKIYEWGSSKWNIMDAIAMVLFFLGLALRFVDETRSIGHLLYSVDMMLWVIRLLDIFSVNKHLGPYVVMIGRMTVDMLYFLFIMAVFLLAYGVARQAILEPKSGASWNLVGEVLFAPYFQVYGELFIERDTNAGSTIYGTPRINNYAETLVTLIMAFYLLVANILLLNLLIAVFNHTYDEVQANSTQIWKFQRYHLIMEYSTRPFLVPPMIMINHFILLMQWLYKVCRGVKEKKQTRRLKFHPKKSQLSRILLFEEECVTSYLRAKTSLELVGHEEKLRVMNERVNKIGATVADLRREGFSREKDIKAAVKGINKDFEALTRAIKKMTSPNSPLPDIQEVMGSTKSLGAMPLAQLNQKTRYPLGNDRFRSPLQSPSPLASPITDCATAPVMHAVQTFRRSSMGDQLHSQVGKAISDQGQERKKQYRHQQLRSAQTVDLEDVPASVEVENAKERPRCASYPNQSALRERKPSNLVHESDVLLERIELQEPASPLSQKNRLHVKSRQSPYPATNLKRAVVRDSAVPWEVPDFDYGPESFTDISLVAKDGVDPWTLDGGTLKFNDIDGFIDRRSSMGTYEVIDGVPRNPIGRTGLRGRGRLPRWGPNKVHCYIVTRCKQDPERNIDQTHGQSCEFYAVNTTKGYGIPSSRVGDRFFLQSTIVDVKEKNEVNSFLERGKEIFKGYLDDRRNTDNAWMEITVIHCHDESGIVTSRFKTDNTGQPWGYSWQEMSTETWLYEPDVAYLRIVADMTRVPLDAAVAALLTWL